MLQVTCMLQYQVRIKAAFLKNQDLINLKFSGEKTVDRKEPSGSS